MSKVVFQREVSQLENKIPGGDSRQRAVRVVRYDAASCKGQPWVGLVVEVASLDAMGNTRWNEEERGRQPMILREYGETIGREAKSDLEIQLLQIVQQMR